MKPKVRFDRALHSQLAEMSAEVAFSTKEEWASWVTFSDEEPEPSAWHLVCGSWIAVLTQRMHSEMKEAAGKTDPVVVKLALNPLSSVASWT